MTVTIDPSEVRTRPTGRTGPGSATSASTSASGRPRATRKSLRLAAFAGLGVVAFAAFSYGAFSFFSDLADPRARTPRPMPMASDWPDLKDGIPTIAKPIVVRTIESKAPAIGATAPQSAAIPGSDAAGAPPSAPPLARAPSLDAKPIGEAARVPFTSPSPVPKLAAAPSVAEPAPAESSPVPLPQLRVNRPDLPIETARTIDAARILSPIEAPRAVAAILPAKAESVRAKAAPSSFVSLPSESDPSPEPQTALAAAEPSPEPSAVPESRAVAAPAPKPKKPAVARTAAKPTRTAAREAEAQAPDVESAPASPAHSAKASSDEPGTFDGIPGGREFRYGVKAIGDLFTGKSDGE